MSRVTPARFAGWRHSCFWLLVPILVFNLLFMRQLPPAFQPDVFWKDIPRAIALPENAFRLLTLMLLIPVMRLRVSTPAQRLGFWLYGIGTLVYFASWGALITWPQSGWSTSAVGFLAPAYTPLIWLAGIGLIGNEPLAPRVPVRPWVYWASSAFFLLCHNLHAGLVYGRAY
jgi:hypothetical protein